MAAVQGDNSPYMHGRVYGDPRRKPLLGLVDEGSSSAAAMENQGVGAHSEPFFDLLQPTTPVIHSSAPSAGANYTPNGPRRVDSATSGEFDFKNDDVLPSYDFQSSGGSARFEGVHVSAAAKPRQASPPPSSYEQICRPRDPPVTYEKYESARPRQEHDKEAYDSATVAAVERTMKKYADNLLRVLEGMSGRLSQLEATTQRLEQSLEKSRGASASGFGEVDGKLRMLENMVREVQRSVQIVRDKQEISEAQFQLKAQQDIKPESSPAKPVSEMQPPPVVPSSVPVTPHHSVAQQQSQPPPQHHLDAHLHQQQVQPTVPQMPVPQAPPAVQPAVFYSAPPPGPPQMVHPGHQHQQHQHQPGGPPPQLHPPPSGHQPEAPPYPPPPQAPVVPQPPVASPPSGPTGYAIDMPQPPPPPPPYMSQSYAPAPPTRPPHIPHQHVPPPAPQMYEPARTSSGQLALPPPPYPQYEPPPPAPGGGYGGGYRIPQAAPVGGGGGGYPHLPTAQPVHSSRPSSRSGVDDVIDKVAAMGFPREQVRSTVQRLTETGQSVDMNVVLDKLMNGGAGTDGPPKGGWFGR